MSLMYHNHPSSHPAIPIHRPFSTVPHRWGGQFSRQRPPSPPESTPIPGRHLVATNAGFPILVISMCHGGVESSPKVVQLASVLSWLWPPKARLIVLRRPWGAPRGNEVTRLSKLLGRTAPLARPCRDSWHWAARSPLTRLRPTLPGGIWSFCKKCLC